MVTRETKFQEVMVVTLSVLVGSFDSHFLHAAGVDTQ